MHTSKQSTVYCCVQFITVTASDSIILFDIVRVINHYFVCMYVCRPIYMHWKARMFSDYIELFEKSITRLQSACRLTTK